ncbi:MAG: TonB-dependent receptor plug domain-containing protein [Thermaurantiacus tibetensis]|uniref:TonB-dependent receptor plug domain-containing protein n=1 Tax=Thermaurantiacus tibetensis TaxID=2759035 RepID=UPI00188E614C|nr:TonB-dependent receptor [Thermaurantiacus tibetensis]
MTRPTPHPPALLAGTLVASVLAAAPSAPAAAQGASAQDTIVVTGSRIRQSPTDSALPLSIFDQTDLRRESINSPEQFIALLTSNGNGLDNLASNADVVSGQARGNNGASSANLRNQGAAATLILLNGRRVPAHGLNGGIVDINQIPLFAVERVEVLRDGASAIYGTDAVGGVINFITRTDFKGVLAQGFVDVTQQGGGNIFRGSVLGGWGDVEERGINLMAGVSVSDHRALRGDQRDFVNTFQPNRGLSPDTRGSPFATIFPLGVGPNTPAGTIIASAATAPFIPGTTIRAGAGINVLDLPGQPGCDAIDGMGPYDELLWDLPGARFACAWDTGRAAVLQQPIETVTWIGRASFRFGDHRLFGEVTGSDASSAKRFSNLQLIPNTTTQNFAFPRTAQNAAVYDRIFDALLAAFPADTVLPTRRGLPIAYRWRCIECGPREIKTETKTLRTMFGAEGPFLFGWDYEGTVSWGWSKAESELGSGYYYRNTTRDPAGNIIANGIVDALNTGVINPFLFPGQTQSQEALALLEAASARGVVLYGGKFGLTQVEASVSGPLIRLPHGRVQAALGIDFRRETYRFNGDRRAATARPFIIAAPFDDANALDKVNRDIIAGYAEVLVPVLPGLDVTGAVRIDDYTGFGTTTNPKVSVRWRPVPPIMLRGSYNTGFRVPTFNQIFNGTLESPYSGRDLADPAKCPGGQPNTAIPGCEVVQPTILTGGKPDLGPEENRQFNAGIVFEPRDRISLAIDYWNIRREGTIQLLPLQQIVANFQLFPERFIRDGAGNLVTIDQRWVNSGQTETSGLDFVGRLGFDALDGQFLAGFDGTMLLKKRSRFVPTADFGPSEIGLFTFNGDLGLRWRHNLFLTYTNGPWTASVSQIFRKGYRNQVLPGVAAGRVRPPDLVEITDDYVIHNVSLGYEVRDWLNLTVGIKNLFNADPPFAIAYDSNTGAGSSWEPRVADPRGRSFTLLAEFRF